MICPLMSRSSRNCEGWVILDDVYCQGNDCKFWSSKIKNDGTDIGNCVVFDIVDMLRGIAVSTDAELVGR